jgi:hypothetical protein
VRKRKKERIRVGVRDGERKKDGLKLGSPNSFLYFSNRA